MDRIETSLPGVWLFEPRVFVDARGFFMETYSKRRFAEMGIHSSFVQDNHSQSAKGTLRGLHFQLQNPQAKLCRVVRGAAWDVAVDVRVGSPTFGQHFGTVLSAENKRQLLVPRGFAHGFLVLVDETEFLYKCDDFYAPGDERSVLWNDADLGIEWPFKTYDIEAPTLSAKDAGAPQLRELETSDLPLYSSSTTPD